MIRKSGGLLRRLARNEWINGMGSSALSLVDKTEE